MVKARTLFEYQLEIAWSNIACKRVKYQWKFHDAEEDAKFHKRFHLTERLLMLSNFLKVELSNKEYEVWLFN